MRKLAAIVASVLLLPAVALAQPVTVEKKVICDSLEAVMASLSGENIKEVPIWFGKEPESELPGYSVLVNEKTGTWSIIQFNQKAACIIGAGEGFQIKFTGPKV
jgi:hypothetical protein